MRDCGNLGLIGIRAGYTVEHALDPGGNRARLWPSRIVPLKCGAVADHEPRILELDPSTLAGVERQLFEFRTTTYGSEDALPGKTVLRAAINDFRSTRRLTLRQSAVRAGAIESDPLLSPASPSGAPPARPPTSPRGRSFRPGSR